MKTGLGASLIKDIAIGGIQMHELFIAVLAQPKDKATVRDILIMNDGMMSGLWGDEQQIAGFQGIRLILHIHGHLAFDAKVELIEVVTVGIDQNP